MQRFVHGRQLQDLIGMFADIDLLYIRRVICIKEQVEGQSAGLSVCELKFRNIHFFRIFVCPSHRSAKGEQLGIEHSANWVLVIKLHVGTLLFRDDFKCCYVHWVRPLRSRSMASWRSSRRDTRSTRSSKFTPLASAP